MSLERIIGASRPRRQLAYSETVASGSPKGYPPLIFTHVESSGAQFMSLLPRILRAVFIRKDAL